MTTLVTTDCVDCGQLITRTYQTWRGRPPLRCETCGKRRRQETRDAAVAKKREARTVLYCRYCAAPAATAQSMACTDDECRRQWRNERMRNYLKGRYADARRCEQCKTPLVGKGTRYGCPVCRRRSARLRAANMKLKQSAEGTRGRGVLIAGFCDRCGRPFTARRYAKPTMFEGMSFCSKACQHGELAERRRAREKGAQITPFQRMKIFERDYWTCQLCRLPVDLDLKAPEPTAPVLDHIVPLARGGDHAHYNLQTAHFLCNSYKSDRTDLLDVEELRTRLATALARRGEPSAAREAS